LIIFEGCFSEGLHIEGRGVVRDSHYLPPPEIGRLEKRWKKARTVQHLGRDFMPNSSATTKNIN
jgi:hypothetical protein